MTGLEPNRSATRRTAGLRASDKPVAVQPLKASAPVGAALALHGVAGASALMHGAQGCSAFAKVFLIQHFREPVALQTTAMDQVSTILGAEGNITQALTTMVARDRPALIGVIATGLSATQGSDLHGTLRDFRAANPHGPAVLGIEAPDYVGGFESGYALAAKALVEQWLAPLIQGDCKPPMAHPGGGVPATGAPLAVLVGSHLTAGDGDVVKALCEAFGFHPVLLPDLSEALDGHLADADYCAVTTGGTTELDVRRLPNAAGSLVIGSSLTEAGRALAQHVPGPQLQINALLGLDAVDRLVLWLHELSGRPVPHWLERDRRRLQDALLDTHVYLGQRRLAAALEPDLLASMAELASGVGLEMVAAVAPTRGDALDGPVPLPGSGEVIIGDLEDLHEAIVRAGGVGLIIGNDHTARLAHNLGCPFVGAGFPLFDRLGAASQTWVGYEGTRQTLFTLANHLRASRPGTIAPYVSRLRPRS